MVELAKRVPLRTVVSAGAGLALATVSYTSNMQVATYVAGNSGWMPILIAGAISFLAAFVFAELVGMFPTAAGIKLFIEQAFSERAALIFATVYITVSVGVVGTETYILANVLHSAFPAIPGLVWIFVFLTTVALVNIRGVTLAGLAQDITTYSLFAGLIGVSLWAVVRNGLTRPDFTLASLVSPGDGLGLAQAVAIGVFLYLGFEWVTPLAEEVHDFKLIPRGMFGAILLLGFSYALFNLAMTTTVPVAVLSQSPVPHVLFGQALLGRAGVMLFLVLSILASTTTFNAGVLTASRFIYAMSRDRALPRVFSRLHPVWATPWPAVLLLVGVTTAVSLAVYFTGYYKVLIFLGAAVECMIYVVMAASLLGLRRRSPERARPFRVPGGWVIPAVVIAVYSVLFVLIFLPDPAHPEDVPSQMIALGVMAGLFVVTLAYVLGVVPRLRARYEAMSRNRQRRRPGRSATSAGG